MSKKPPVTLSNDTKKHVANMKAIYADFVNELEKIKQLGDKEIRHILEEDEEIHIERIRKKLHELDK